MRTTISARHVPVDESLRTRATQVLERLGHLSNRAIEATAVFDVVAGAPAAELRLHCTGGRVLVATADGLEHRLALDLAEARMKRQLMKVATRPRGSRHVPVG